MKFGKGMTREELSPQLRNLVQKRAEDLSGGKDGPYCRIDADCPPGFVCVRGRCVPQTA